MIFFGEVAERFLYVFLSGSFREVEGFVVVFGGVVGFDRAQVLLQGGGSQKPDHILIMNINKQMGRQESTQKGSLRDIPKTIRIYGYPLIKFMMLKHYLAKLVYFFYHIQYSCQMQKDDHEEEPPKNENKLTNEQKLSNASQSQSNLPTEMQKKHVYDVYDKIAPHFSHTRYKPWPRIQKFLNELQPGSLVFDVGCGNGKYLGVNKDLYMVGTDRSIGLLKTAQEKSEGFQLFAADSIYLPLRDQSCDAFISIAVIHHFSNQSLRHRAIDQLTRITRVGGQGLIYVWAFEQEWQGQQSISKKKFTQQDVFVPWHLHFKYESDLEKIDTEGCQIDHNKKSVIYKRYYHVFKHGELEGLLEKHEDLKIVDAYYDKENWCCRVRRVK